MNRDASAGLWQRPGAARRVLSILSLCAYPVLTHLSTSGGLPYAATVAWLCLAGLLYLLLPGRWGMLASGLLVAALLVTDADALVKLPSVVINLALGAWFLSSLAPGEEPIIAWFARLERGTLEPDLTAYTRRLTIIWVAFFTIMALTAAVLALFARPQAWSLFANGINYLLVGMLFAGEYAYRRIRYRHYTHASLPKLIRMVVASGGLTSRRTGRNGPA